MAKEKAGYTGGEIVAMVAPMFSESPEDIRHAAIIIHTHEGIQILGCKHATMLAEMVVNLAAHDASHSGKNHESHGYTSRKKWRRRWMGGFLL